MKTMFKEVQYMDIFTVGQIQSTFLIYFMVHGVSQKW